jgi:hypothetical protein
VALVVAARKCEVRFSARHGGFEKPELESGEA